ncbi:MAG: hypothetical protein R3E12_11455 [Candidatus Eisenbacteria bacterium]
MSGTGEKTGAARTGADARAQGGAPGPGARSDVPSGISWLIAVLLLAAIAFRCWAAFVRFLDVDELEHLNAAWFMSDGETIYGSFFENHPPLLHVLLQPIVRSTTDAVHIILAARGLILVLALACLYLTAVLGRRLAGRTGFVLAPLLLISATYFFNEGLEVRPDVPACLLLLGTLVVLTGGTGTRRFVWSGALFAVAGFATPKVVYAGAGAFLVAILWGSLRATAGGVFRRSIAAIAGASLVCLAGVLVLAAFGVLGGFVRDVLGISLHMEIDQVSEMRARILGDCLTVNVGLWITG